MAQCEDCANPAVGNCNVCGLPVCENHADERHGRIECKVCAS